MEYHNKMLCVTCEELIGGDNPIMKKGTLYSNLYRKNIVGVNRGGGEGGYALYSYDSMPDKYKKKFVAKYGDPREVIREREMRERIKFDDTARAWYQQYEYTKSNGDRTKLTPEQIEEYTVNASVLNELLKMKNERRAMMSSLNARATEVWLLVLENSERLREVYKHTLPTSESGLQKRIRAYEKEGYTSLVSKKLGNINTVKLTEEGGRLVIALKRSHTPRYSDEQLFDKYNELAVFHGWKPLKSVRTLQLWLNSAAVQPLWWDAVHGEQSARQKFGRKQKTELPKKRDSLWYGDGTKLNLYYRAEDGKVRTTGVYEVVDSMSEVLLGYYISDTEDYNAQYHAYRMAIQRSGHRPYEIVHDNQGGHKKLSSKKRSEKMEDKSFLDRICHIHRPTKPYNGESKTIESIFGRFQAQILARYYNFTGQNVMAKKETSRPNMEMIAANKDKLPTYQELCELYARCREEWNEMQHPKLDGRRIELYENSVNEETDVVGPYEMQDMFWVMSDKPVTFTDSGIKMTINKQTYQWEVFAEENGQLVPDLEWRSRYTWAKFYVQYDPDDKTSVNLYEIDKAGRRHFCRVARPYWSIHRAMQEQSAEEKARIHAELNRNEQVRVERVVAGRKIAYSHGTDPEQNGLYYPKPKGMTKERYEQIQERIGNLQPGQDLTHAEIVELGLFTKDLSNQDWKDYIGLDEKMIATKL